jgi:hypothetical protein
MHEPDPTYVCGECGHQWCSPFPPDRCESCNAHGSNLRQFTDLDAADDYSEASYHGYLERRHAF